MDHKSWGKNTKTLSSMRHDDNNERKVEMKSINHQSQILPPLKLANFLTFRLESFLLGNDRLKTANLNNEYCNYIKFFA